MSAGRYSTIGPGAQWESGENAEPGPVIDALSSVRTTDYAEGNTFPKDDLPSFGSMIEDFCGEDLPHFCEDCGNTAIFGKTCNSSQCPRCWASWALRTATGRGRDNPGVVPALEALRKEQYGKSPEGVNIKFHHTIFSPPRYLALEAENPREKAFEILKAALQAMNIPGAYIVYHPYRGKDELADMKEDAETEGYDPEQELIRDLSDEAWDEDEWLRENDDRGEWKDRLGPDRTWEGDVEEEVVFSPHFHVIAVSDYMKGEGLTEYVHEETGWVIHRITGGNSSVSVPNLDALGRVVTYCVSHAGLYEDSNGNTRIAARRVGDLHGIGVTEATERAGDVAARKAAPSTLGITSRPLACNQMLPVNDEDGHECDEPGCCEPETGTDAVTRTKQAHQIQVSREASAGRLPDKQVGSLGRDRDKELPTSTGQDLRGSGTFDAPRPISRGASEDDDEAEETAEEDPEDDGPEREMCNGGFLSLGAAPAKLEDDDWREQAEHAEELQTTLDEWAEKEDWIG